MIKSYFWRFWNNITPAFSCLKELYQFRNFTHNCKLPWFDEVGQFYKNSHHRGKNINWLACTVILNFRLLQSYPLTEVSSSKLRTREGISLSWYSRVLKFLLLWYGFPTEPWPSGWSCSSVLCLFDLESAKASLHNNFRLESRISWRSATYIPSIDTS